MATYSKVLVGTDGSETSLKAVTKAAEVADAHDAELLIGCAYTPLESRASAAAADELGSDAYQIQGDNPAGDIVRAARERAVAAGVPADRVTTKTIEGGPVDSLIKLTKTENIDLLIVGNRGMNSFASRIWGSVPGDAARRADCDVLIVHTT